MVSSAAGFSFANTVLARHRWPHHTCFPFMGIPQSASPVAAHAYSPSSVLLPANLQRRAVRLAVFATAEHRWNSFGFRMLM